MSDPLTPAAAPSAATSAVRRVAYVMSRFPKLTETFVLFEMVAVEEADVRVELFPLLRERTDVTHPEARPYVERAHFLPFLSPAILGSQLHFLVRRPRAYLGALAAIVRGTWGSRNYLLGGLAIFPKVVHAARQMAVLGVEHVHCHFSSHPAVAGFVIHRLTGIPFSFTAHGSDLHVDRHMLCAKLAEAAFAVTISQDNLAEMTAECGERAVGRTVVLPCGVDTAVFRPPSTTVRAPERPFRIVCVGTLHAVKGQAHLVEACRLLRDAGLDIVCDLVGGGRDEAMLRERIAAAGLQDRVHLAGLLTRAQVADLLVRGHVLAAPSVPTREGKREGIPVVLMEAMASGLAVVASRLSGIPELVRDGETGLLVEPGDSAALAAAIRRLYDDPALRSRLAKAGRETVERDFDATRNARRLLSLIDAARAGQLPVGATAAAGARTAASHPVSDGLEAGSRT